MTKMISNIVFTKNRPLQLEAYLESLYRYFPAEKIQTYIIYKVELFSEQYEALFRKYPDCIVVKEKDFHSDFLGILNKVNTKYILFGIDDVVYFDSVEIDLIEKCFDGFPGDIFGFTFRFGPEYLKDGDDTIIETTVAGETAYKLNWQKGQSAHTRYPFELCCTVYSTELVKKIISSVMNTNPVIRKIFSPDSPLIKGLRNTKFARKALKSFGYFFSPNTLESWNCRWCQNNADQLPASIYFQRLCAVAIQVNMVNTTTKDSFNGSEDYTVEALNGKYKQGYRLDTNFLASNKPDGTHGGIELFNLTKPVKINI